MKNLLLILLFLPLNSWSQDQVGLMYIDRVPRWRISSFDVNAGYRWYFRDINRPRINEFVKDESIFEDPNATFYTWSSPFSNRNRSLSVGGNVAFQVPRRNREVKFGINYMEYASSWGSSTIDYQVVNKDTAQLISSAGGVTQVMVDSVWIDRESVRISQRFFSINGAYLLRTERNRISGYAGFGGQLGLSLAKTAVYSRSQSWRRQYVDSNGYPVFQDHFQVNQYGYINWSEQPISSESMTTDAKRVFLFAPYLPVGVEYAPFIGNRWLSGISLELKGTIGAEFHFMSGTKTGIRPFYNVGLGLKYFINRAARSRILRKENDPRLG